MGDEHLWVVGQGKITDLEHSYTVPEYFRTNIGTWGWGNAVAFESAETGRKYSQHQVLSNSHAFAAALIKLSPELNLQRTSLNVVAVMLKNIPEYASIIFGIWEAGLVCTPVNPSSTEDELTHHLNTTKAIIVITSAQLLPVVHAIQCKSTTIKKIIIVEDDPSEINEAYCLDYFSMLKTETTGVDFYTGLMNDNDIALIPFSSGTSGLPKGVLLTHSAILTNAILFSHPDVLFMKKIQNGNNSPDRTIAILPFFHILGFVSTILVSMLKGCHVMTMSSFNPKTFAKTIKAFRPTVLILVPTLVDFICHTDNIKASDLDQVHCVFSGGAPAGRVLIDKIQRKIKNGVFVEGYGLTEVAGALILPRYQSQKSGSIGTPLPQVVAKIIDVENGATLGLSLGRGEHGELCVKTPTIMKGYLNNEQATKECIDEDGWFHTGDIGYYDESGCFFIVGRLKEIIKVKGFQVAPLELENVIRSHEKVDDVAVIGIPDAVSGEVPRAFVVPKAGQEFMLTQGEIMDFVQSKVSPYKYLRGGVIFVKEIPKTGSGKILRRVLKETYA